MSKHEKLARALLGVILSTMREMAKDEDVLPVDKQIETLANISTKAFQDLNVEVTSENASILAYEGLEYFTYSFPNYRNN